GLTGERNGVYYRGLVLGPVDVPLKEYPGNQTDPETGEVLLDKPEFPQYVDLMDHIVRINIESSEHYLNPLKLPELQPSEQFLDTEYQKFASRNGIEPSSNEKEVLEQFFQDYESTHDKNVQSIFTHPPASLPDVISKWDDYVDLNMHEYFEMEVDRNEFLRIV